MAEGSMRLLARYLSKQELPFVFTEEQARLWTRGGPDTTRRIRELRRYGWVIDGCHDDHSLEPRHYRLVTVGKHVWEAGFRLDNHDNRENYRARTVRIVPDDA